ncbi:MAG: glycosyltransferase family 39 protein [Bacteroidales bacterium]
MKKSSEISQTLPFYFFGVGIFLIIVCKDVFSNGMFLDGLIYSTVSKNLADGLGTFWNPHFTSTCLSVFHEHPPLAFGIQSIFYTIIGESRFVDKFYSLFTVLIVAVIILRIWHILGYRHGWFPLFIWLMTPTVFWASYNNLLENTLTVFTSLSILFYLKNQVSKRYIFIFLSGFVLALGFLTKGFVAFFPWTFPFLLWIFLKQESFVKMAGDTALILFFTITPLILITVLFPEARLGLHKYIDNQVIDSIKHTVTVNSRFDILIRLLFELIPVLVLSILLLTWTRIRKFPVILLKENVKKVLVFVFLGLTGVLPVMISMKQSGFYIIPTYPFFAIGASILVYPAIDSFYLKLNFKSKSFLIFKWAAIGLFISGVVMSIYFSDHFSRDSRLIKETYTILPNIPKGSIININPDMYTDWSLHAYFARFGNNSLDPDLSTKRDFLLIKSEFYSDTLGRNYSIVKLNTVNLKLFKRR